MNINARVPINPYIYPLLPLDVRTSIKVHNASLLIKLICEEFEVSREDLLGVRRKRAFAEARHIAYKVIKDRTRMTLKSIGKQFSGRNHASIIYGVESANNLITYDPSIRKKYESILKKLEKE